ncbi:hypothetical protein [Streptomyces sp. NPDC102490]|uniref:hypothetical protein n=1 Tax=Streptomyces sp. NPDC102490 TaxID=3366183 RepID=UPI00380DF72C
MDQHKVVEALHGVGSRQAGALHEYGIHTVGLPAVVSPDVFTSRSAPPPRPSSLSSSSVQLLDARGFT